MTETNNEGTGSSEITPAPEQDWHQNDEVFAKLDRSRGGFDRSEGTSVWGRTTDEAFKLKEKLTNIIKASKDFLDKNESKEIKLRGEVLEYFLEEVVTKAARLTQKENTRYMVRDLHGEVKENKLHLLVRLVTEKKDNKKWLMGETTKAAAVFETSNNNPNSLSRPKIFSEKKDLKNDVTQVLSVSKVTEALHDVVNSKFDQDLNVSMLIKNNELVLKLTKKEEVEKKKLEKNKFATKTELNNRLANLDDALREYFEVSARYREEGATKERKMRKAGHEKRKTYDPIKGFVEKEGLLRIAIDDLSKLFSEKNKGDTVKRFRDKEAISELKELVKKHAIFLRDENVLEEIADLLDKADELKLSSLIPESISGKKESQRKKKSKKTKPEGPDKNTIPEISPNENKDKNDEDKSTIATQENLKSAPVVDDSKKTGLSAQPEIPDTLMELLGDYEASKQEMKKSNEEDYFDASNRFQVNLLKIVNFLQNKGVVVSYNNEEDNKILGVINSLNTNEDKNNRDKWLKQLEDWVDKKYKQYEQDILYNKK